MSWRYIRAVAEVNHDLSSPEQFTLWILAYHANTDGECWPSTRTICHLTKLSRSTVKRALKALADRQLIAVSEDYPGRSKVYKVIPGWVHSEPGGGSEWTPRNTDPIIEDLPSEDSCAGAEVKLSELDKPVPGQKLGKVSASTMPTKATQPETLEGVWKSMCGERYGFQPGWLQKEKAQGKKLIARLGPEDVISVVETLIEHWIQFTEFVRGQNPKAGAPGKPVIGYVLVHCAEAVEFAHKMRAPKPTTASNTSEPSAAVVNPPPVKEEPPQGVDASGGQYLTADDLKGLLEDD